ncbi:MAG: putative molybdenum carrier protein [Kiritimatiellae bacterium]|jgi:hypothetical protein|nr:putative molybdenum carrier protein [Kiritimatiellia bacterium]MDY0150551.1 putative molybdenum carrier protein [Kiritimatiellia bacterium]
MKLRKIVSGGQTGADQGALAACVQRSFPYGGWVPKGRRSEKGKVPAKYRMRQHWSRHYPPRTERNVIDSDCTVIFTYGKPEGGSLLTIDFARQHRKPCLKADLNQPHDVVVAKLRRWLKRHCPDNGVLNVAGSRRSKAPGIHMAVKRVIRDLLDGLANFHSVEKS